MVVNVISLVTPMKSDFSVDYIGLLNIVRLHLSYNNTHFLVNATTGESMSLSLVEKIQIIRFLRFHFGNFITLYSGSCFCSTIDSLKFLDLLNCEDIDFVLQITPYYFNPTDVGIINHFTILANYSKHPIIIYNVPKRTGVDMSHYCLVRVLSLSNVVGIKDSSGSYLSSLERLQICNRYGKWFFCGDDLQVFSFLKLGCYGLVSVFSSFFPVEFCDFLVSGTLCNFDRFVTLIGFLTQFSNPVLIKFLLSKVLSFACFYRLPLVALGCSYKRLIFSKLNSYCPNIILYKFYEFTARLNEFC